MTILMSRGILKGIMKNKVLKLPKLSKEIILIGKQIFLILSMIIINK